MLILTAHNVSGGVGTKPDGTADYDVWVGINQVRIWGGKVTGHLRNAGAAVLLRKIADRMDNTPPSLPPKKDKPCRK